MSREIILKMLKVAGHEELSAQVDALIRPAIHITCANVCAPPFSLDGREPTHDTAPEEFAEAMRTLTLGASRFGGLPDLPPGVEWPARDGVPMELVAQIRLADVAIDDPESSLPHAGSLLFFYNSQWLTFDQDQDHDCCCVVFHDGPDDQLVRTRPPPGDHEGNAGPAPYLHGLSTLSFSRCEMVPAEISPFIDANSALGGVWPRFVTNYWGVYSPDANNGQNHLLGYVDAPDYASAHLNGVEDRCLLQVDSDDAAGFQWGDCDRLYFMISRGDLVAREFSKTRLYSQLG